MFISDYRKAHIDLDVTKKVAEREREKGASWEICEVESIIFRFDQIDYVVYDWDMIFDIRDLRNEIEAVRSISTLHEWVASHVEGAPFVVVGNMLLKPAALPFRRYNSRAKGGGYYLSWHASARNRDLSDTIATMSGVIVDYQKMCFRKHHAA